MRVLQINAVYEKSSTGRTTKELHESLQSRGIESYVACRDLATLKEHAYQIGNNCDWKVHAFLSRITGKQGYFSRNATKKLLQYMDSLKPDIIHLRNLHSNYIHLPTLLHYIAEHQIATVLTLHDCWFYTGKCMYYIESGCNRWLKGCGHCPALKNGNKSWFFDRSAAVLKDRAADFGAIEKLAVIGVSQWVTEDASKSILKNAKIIQCIYNWIDLELFYPHDDTAIRKEMRLTNKFVIFGIASGWSRQKGIDVFHELADILPDDCQIVLAGDASQIDVKNKKIKFLGTIMDVNQLSDLYAMADVFVNPSIQETFGKTTAEAMACGTPVVAYNGTATPELVGTDGTCGYLVDENKAELYKDKILKIKSKTKKTYTQAVRQRAEKLFSKEKNIEKYIDVYNRLISM